MADSRKVLITGATGAIGGQTARKLAANGHHIFLSGRNEDKLQQVVDECSDAESVGSQTAELTSMAETQELVKAANEAMEGVDVVVHAAGIGFIKSLEETSDADYVRVTNINQRSTFLLCRSVLPLMADNGGGLFVTIPGVVGKAGMKNASAYCASKWATVGFIKAVQDEYQRKKIRFSLLYFGGVDSAFWDDLDMKVKRDFIISPEIAADYIVSAVEAPPHLVQNEVVIQPASHQLVQ